jgi:hypothetical protein
MEEVGISVGIEEIGKGIKTSIGKSIATVLTEDGVAKVREGRFAGFHEGIVGVVDPILTDEQVGLVTENTVVELIFSWGWSKSELMAVGKGASEGAVVVSGGGVVCN